MTKIKDKAHIINTDSGEVEENYFLKRMKTLGIDASNNFIESVNPNIPDTTPQRFQLFEETEKGDIKINYFRLDGWYTNYKQGGEGWGKHFTRTRLKIPYVDENGKEQKYKSPLKSGNYPYFPVSIIKKYQQKTEIGTLIITEGEFKAVVGCKHGLDVIGVSGIHNFYDNYEEKKLHRQILELLIGCKVRRVLFLTDADTITIKYHPEKDLSKRPNLFFSAVKNFREAIMHEMNNEENKLALTDAYFGHIKTTLNDINQKGLDDLLEAQFNKEAVIKDLLNLTFSDIYFWSENIVTKLNKIQEHFGLLTPDNFYLVYGQTIKQQEFNFRNQTYVWVFEDGSDKGKIERIKHREVDKFMRIGCDWFKVVAVPNKYNELEESVAKWKVGEIARDYQKKYPKFLEEIPKYDAWCNQPSMDSSYKREHNGCFNIFNPLKHLPKPGSIEKTLFFIKHLFEGEGEVSFGDGKFTEKSILGDPFTVALDYLTLMYQRPKQILPVLCLVSPENGTGKSTFLKWLQDIYGSNATIIDNERFKQNFNGHYITKYIIGIDEGFLDVEKRAEKERLKKLATDERQYLEFKGADVQEIDFYAKLIISSNDADNLMKIEAGETRWWVVRVRTFKEKGYNVDPDFREKMRSEIPSFLDFLQHRSVFHPKIDRAWFDSEHFFTEQMRIIVENTRNYLDRVVDDYVVEMFLYYDLAEITMPLEMLVDFINRQNKYKLDKLQVKKYLKEKKGMTAEEKPKHISFPTGYTDTEIPALLMASGTYRYYIFRREKWLKIEPNQETGGEDGGSESNNTTPIIGDDMPF